MHDSAHRRTLTPDPSLVSHQLNLASPGPSMSPLALLESFAAFAQAEPLPHAVEPAKRPSSTSYQLQPTRSGRMQPIAPDELSAWLGLEQYLDFPSEDEGDDDYRPSPPKRRKRKHAGNDGDDDDGSSSVSGDYVLESDTGDEEVVAGMSSFPPGPSEPSHLRSPQSMAAAAYRPPAGSPGRVVSMSSIEIGPGQRTDAGPSRLAPPPQLPSAPKPAKAKAKGKAKAQAKPAGPAPEDIPVLPPHLAPAIAPAPAVASSTAADASVPPPVSANSGKRGPTRILGYSKPLDNPIEPVSAPKAAAPAKRKGAPIVGQVTQSRIRELEASAKRVPELEQRIRELEHQLALYEARHAAYAAGYEAGRGSGATPTA